MLSHHNLVSNFLACAGLFPIGPQDVTLSFLPLSHVFQRIADYLFLYRGVTIHYLTSIEQAPRALTDVRPTVMASVPRLYERAYLRVQDNVRKEPERSQRVFRWAVELGERCVGSGELDVPLRLALPYAAASRLVFRKIQDRFGGRLRFAIAGGAALPEQVGRFFAAVGIGVYEGYGLTETSPVLCVNHPGATRFGAVGRAIPGVELAIDEDGEILVKSPGLMRGYWNLPEATAQAIDAEGWFHTGDVGHVDAEGFLHITDRKKDLIVTSGGKNIAPQPIEQLLTASGALAQAIVIGDNYPYLTALLVPSSEDLPAELARLSPAERIQHPLLRGQPQGRRARAGPTVPSDGARVLGRARRDDPDPQAQAPRHPRALRRAGRLDVPQVAAPAGLAGLSASSRPIISPTTSKPSCQKAGSAMSIPASASASWGRAAPPWARSRRYPARKPSGSW
jgi:long-chain acyl-CoA synthetase